MDVKKKIEAYLEAHREEMVEDICTLCRIDSCRSAYQEGKPFGEGPWRALGQALAMAERYGFSIENHDNFVGTADLNEKERGLDILAHLDVVPPGEGWTVTEPFEPLVKDGVIYGRGTADDKGPAVAVLYAMRAIRDLEIPLAKNVRLILGTDEECGGEDIAHYYDEEPEAPMTLTPDSEFPVVNIEKGRLRGHFSAEYEACGDLPRILSLTGGEEINVVPGTAKARIQGLDEDTAREACLLAQEKTGVSFEILATQEGLEITAHGEVAHASSPAQGKNALTALVFLLCSLPLAGCGLLRCLRGLADCFPWDDTDGSGLGVAMSEERSGSLTAVLSLLEADETHLEGSFDIRYPLCGTEENLRLPVQKRLREAGLTPDENPLNPPHFVDGDSAFIRTILRAYESCTGKPGKCLYTGGGTYVHHVKNGVAFGAAMPGVDNRIHGTDEFARIDELLLTARIYAQAIVDLCS